MPGPPPRPSRPTAPRPPTVQPDRAAGTTPPKPAQPAQGPQARAAAQAPISPQPQRDVEPRRPGFVRYGLPVSTTDQLPGREIAATVGIVVGISTRPRDMAHNPEMAYFNAAARQDALGAMVAQAQEAGADAVVGIRFDGGKISETVTELAAYGTAVTLR